MRHLFSVLAVVGVLTCCYVALGDPGVDVAGAETPADADIKAPTEQLDEIGIFKRAYRAIKKGEGVARELAALALIAVGLLFQWIEKSDKYSKYLPGVFKRKRGRFILVSVLAAAGALGHQALAGSFGDWDVWKPALQILIEASFAYVGVKSLLNKKSA